MACAIICTSTQNKAIPEKAMTREPIETLDIGMHDGKEFFVREIIDLQGQKVNVPAGVTITFKKGGAIVNGTLYGNETKLSSMKEGVLGVKLAGTWCVNTINDIYFSKKHLSDSEVIGNINAIQSDYVQNNITISHDYTITIIKSGGYGIDFKSNTTLNFNGTLTLAPNNHKSYSIFNIKNKTNVSIKGGTIMGDVGYHVYIDGSTSEWGMGVTVYESQNILIEDLHITQCTGDGIYITGGKESHVGIYDHASKNITVRNVTCDSNRRQGISIIHVDGLRVCDSSFINTGQKEFTAPGAGIDVEPNVNNGQNMSVRNLIVENCVIAHNRGPAVSCSSTFEANGRQNFENLLFANCQTDGTLRAQSTDLTFRSCSFKEVRFAAIHSPTQITMDGCSIEGGYGIIIYAPTESGIDYKNRLLSINLKNCRISVAAGETSTKSLISCYKHYVPNIECINIENCNLIIPKAKEESFKLIDYDMKDKLRITSSIIRTEGRDLDLRGTVLRGNIIHCRSINRLSIENNNRVITAE